MWRLISSTSKLLPFKREANIRFFFSRYGLLANNAILATEQHMPLYQELCGKYPVSHTAGGSAQNTMRAAQWLLPPHSTVYIGCVGKDDNGRRLRTVANKDGLRVEYQEVEGTPTGTCACLITSSGQYRSLVANLGAANCFSVNHLETPVVKEVLQHGQIFYLTGFFITVSLPTMLKTAQYAEEHQRTVCFNLSAPFVVEFYLSQVNEMLPHVDFLFGNETEVVALATALNIKSQGISEIAQSLANLPKTRAKPRYVIVTQGPSPTIVASATNVTAYPVKVIDPAEIVDTNGAGDAFVGGFLSQLVRKSSLEVCVRAGQYAAAVIIKQSGTNFPEKPINLTF